MELISSPDKSFSGIIHHAHSTTQLPQPSSPNGRDLPPHLKKGYFSIKNTPKHKKVAAHLPINNFDFKLNTTKSLKVLRSESQDLEQMTTREFINQVNNQIDVQGFLKLKGINLRDESQLLQMEEQRRRIKQFFEVKHKQRKDNLQRRDSLIGNLKHMTREEREAFRRKEKIQ